MYDPTGPTADPPAANRQCAELLRQYADLLESQGANPYRVGAYRRAAQSLLSLERDVRVVEETEGMAGLEALPAVGKGIAAAIHEILRTARLSRIERLRGGLDPVELFRTVPGVGRGLAARIWETLHADTLEEVERAAWDGRLEHLPGLGPRRLAALRASLGAMLSRTRVPRREMGPEPSAATLLAVDREYREQAFLDRLPKIAPRRFNPEGRAWLPVLHADRDGWHFTALFSNTPRAHELRRTGDWVVIYFYDQDHHEGQRTVVTETRGPRVGQRVVRGRESEGNDGAGS